MEGLKFHIAIAIHYKVGLSFNDPKQLAKEFHEIYARFGDDWEDVVKNIAIASIKDATQYYQAFDFFERRGDIDNSI